MQLLSSACPPRVHAVYFRTLWNGWVCYDGMKLLLQQRGCLLGCGWDDDALGHYACCGVYWQFVHLPRPRDAAFFIIPDLSHDDVVRLAIGMYALYRTVNFLRFGAAAGHSDSILTLLRLFAKRGASTSSTQKLLQF